MRQGLNTCSRPMCDALVMFAVSCFSVAGILLNHTNNQVYIPGTEKCLVFYFWHPMLVRPAMKRLFGLKAKNGLGRFAPSALPHYHDYHVI